MQRKIFFALAVIAGVALVALAAGPFEEWQKSGHANKQLAIEEATVEHRGATAAHCGRCHAQQGFIAYLEQLQKGDPGLLKKPDGSAADVPYLTSLGLTEATVQPITCTACHRQDNFQLRVQNDTYILPAGFTAQGVGKGALCMTCHNTRNGRISWEATELKSYSAPHVSAQADVIMGKNSYFLNDTLDGASPHATFTGDACVTCHLKLGQEGHTFEPSKTVCASCHGPAMKIEFVQEPIEYLLEQLKGLIVQRALLVKEKIATVRAWDPVTDKYTDNVVVEGKQIINAELVEIHGQISFKFLLTDGKEVYSQLRDIKDAAGQAVYALSDPIVRAAWNYFLIESDGSFGVHNPSFARDVLLATLKALR